MKTITLDEFRAHAQAGKPAFIGGRWACNEQGERIESRPGDQVAFRVVEINGGNPVLGLHDEICPGGVFAPPVNADGSLPEEKFQIPDPKSQEVSSAHSDRPVEDAVTELLERTVAETPVDFPTPDPRSPITAL